MVYQGSSLEARVEIKDHHRPLKFFELNLKSEGIFTAFWIMFIVTVFVEMEILTKVSHVSLSRKMKPSIQSEEDDFVPELHRNVHPRERPDWEETLSAMVNQCYVCVCSIYKER